MALKYFLIGLCCCLIISQGLTASLDNAEVRDSVPNTTIAPVTKTTENPSTTEKPTPSSTTEKPTPSTTTEKPTPSTTTEKPTPSTTTEKPTPSTTKAPTPPPTTISPTPEPTTPKPSTPVPPPTTAAPPAPPAPTPLPDPVPGSWVLKNSTTNLTCVVIHAALRMKIPYLTIDNKTEWGQLNLNKSANITGQCNNETLHQNITSVRLWWDNNKSFLELTFTRYDDKKSFNITELLLSQNISGDAFPNSTDTGLMVFRGNGSGLFAVESVPLGSSYRCTRKVNLNLTEERMVNNEYMNATLTFSKVQIQAYVNSTTDGFGAAYDCPGMDASDIVPIAVGCALAGLVIGVLIAYLVGRRRSHARGYLSM